MTARLPVLFLLGVCLPAAFAEVATDGSLGPAIGLSGPAFEISAELGRREGGNLFHSFRAFSLGSGESANFTGPESIERVIGRVTGGAASPIDGALRCAIPRADLYLFNPAGVLFGPSATLDVQGSFYAASADYLALADGARFGADLAQPSRFSSAEPAAFGFLAASPAPVRKEQSFLQVPAGETLGLFGGEIVLRDAHPPTGARDGQAEERQGLSAPGGTIHLAALGGPGEVTPGQAGSADYSGLLHLGDVPLNSANAGHPANLDASGENGGRILLEGGRVVLENVYVFADTAGSGSGGGIEIRADKVAAHGSRITAETLLGTTSQAGTVGVHARRVVLSGGTQLAATTRGAGKGGDVRVEAQEQVEITGELSVVLFGSEVIFPSGLQSKTTGSGHGGLIEVRAPLVSIRQGGSLETDSLGLGDGGRILLQADRLALSGGARISSNTRYSRGGDIQIEAGTIELDAAIVSSRSSGSGTGGSIVLRGRELALANLSRVEASSRAGGDSGSLAVETGHVRLQQGSSLSVAATGTGRAGDIEIHSAALDLDRAAITAQANHAGGGNIRIDGPPDWMHLRDSRITARAEGMARGDSGGNVYIQGGKFFILDSSLVLASAVGGDGGNIDISARNFIASADSVLDASSELGVDGTVQVHALDTHAAEDLMQAPPLLDARALLDSLCRGRSVPSFSRLVVKRYAGGGATPEDWQGSVSGEAHAPPPGRNAGPGVAGGNANPECRPDCGR